MAPFATKAQLYTLVADRTALDRQVDELRAANAVRLLQLPCGTDEFAVMLTSDYCAALRNSQAQLLQQASGGGGGAGGGADASAQPGQPAAPAAQAAQAAAAAAVFDWMERRVLPGCTQVMITHARLMELLAGGRSAGAQQHAR